jgi:hypothetical protein
MSGRNRGANTGLKIGRTLELARKQRGLSLKQVEQETKIRARYLRELERENFDVLPPVYVRGSLKTYANFLGLDGELLTRELKRRQPPEDEPEAPTLTELPKSDFLDRYLISIGGAAGEMAEDEEDGAENNRLYLASAAFLVLILVAVALALTLPRDSQPAVSQLREPLLSQAPSEVSRAASESNERAQPLPQQEDSERSRDAESAVPQVEQPTGPSNGNAYSPPAQTGWEGSGSQITQVPRNVQATRTAPPPDATATARPEATPEPSTSPPAGETATTEPDTAPTPSTSPPVETPVQGGQGMATGVQADSPASQNRQVRVVNTGGVGLSGGSQRDNAVKIRHGKNGVDVRVAENPADVADSDPLP